MLPTITAISRRVLLTGRLPRDLSGDNEAALFREAWAGRGVVNAVYAAVGDDLEAALTNEPRLVVLVCSQLDALAHRPDHDVSDRAAERDFHLGQLAKAVATAVERLIQLGPLRIVVSTDHGSTRLPASQQPLTLPPWAAPEADFDRHRRCVRVKAGARLDEGRWWRLSAEAFGLSAGYAVPRGARAIDRRPAAFTHGGLLPEEVVVPVQVWQPGCAPAVSLTVDQVSAPLRLGRPAPVRLRVLNPGTFAVRDLTLVLPDFGLAVWVENVPPSGTAEAEITLRLPLHAPVADNDTYAVRVRATYTFGGRERAEDLDVRLRVQRLYRPDTMGDLFNG
jgi:hypothetical protein